MKKTTSQAEPSLLRWWIQDLDAQTADSDRIQAWIQQEKIQGMLITLEHLSDLIFMTDEFDALIEQQSQTAIARVLDDCLFQLGMKLSNRMKSVEMGWVSLPLLPGMIADQTKLLERVALWDAHLPAGNVLIQLPALPENIAQTPELLRMGKSLHFTEVIFEEQLNTILNAYREGLAARHQLGQNLSRIHAFCSIPLQREAEAADEFLSMLQKVQDSDAFQPLWAAGANPLTLLWKPGYSATGTVPETWFVNRLPQSSAVEADLFQAARVLQDLPIREPISLPQRESEPKTDPAAQAASFYDRLRKQQEALYQQALRVLREKAVQLHAGKKPFQIHHPEKLALAEGVAEIQKADWIARIWQHDYTVWNSRPDEITNRLGWLHTPQTMKHHLAEIQQFVEEVRSENRFTHAVLCGMGGSSLAPEVFQKTFGVKPGYLELLVLDSTDPWAMQQVDEKLDLEKTLFILSTKSGSTIETISMMKYFYHRLVNHLGVERAGGQMIVITDPGSSLIPIAEGHHFRKIFLNDPNIGGRYSALSFFGLVPAALTGIPIESLLESARRMQVQLSRYSGDASQGLPLGAALGQAARSGRDKLTFILPPSLESFASWVEQLVAESTGKQGKGILPVVGEKLMAPRYYQEDRLFVYMHLEGETQHREEVQALIQSGFPVIELTLTSILEMGAQFMLWEFATALASALMGIHPFDQPDVENAKVMARNKMAAYKESGSLSSQLPCLQQQEISVFGSFEGQTLSDILMAFLQPIHGDQYCAILAYLPPSEEVQAALQDIQTRIHSQKHCAVTVGIGPRYLHSTGQLHKGDRGNGVFLFLTSDPLMDLPIPDEMDLPGSSMSFGILKIAAALGDQEVLQAAGRPVLHIHLGKDVYSGLKQLTLALLKLE